MSASDPGVRGADGPESQPDSSYERAVLRFGELCDLAPGQQRAALEHLAREDAALARLVAELLEGDAHPVKALQRPLELPTTSVAAPRRVAGYELVSELGRGGMGVVYEALQPEPRRTVALKLIRPGHVTSELLERFKREARALGALNHPGIAQVYAAGTTATEDGEQPFIAMELVRGERIDRHVHNRRLDVRGTLGLLARLCDALHHAHQAGVVHRDLKPGNVLVDSQGSPKVLDFGVARVVGAERAESERTRTGQLVGTLAYMSPEQVRGDPDQIDARTDVYALGVLAYELLTGARPLEVDSKSLPEAARAIAEDEPLALGRVDPRLSGDVERIVGKALAKDVEQRYRSAAALAADLRRHLASEPIAARPPSRSYVLRKFARRNRGLVTAVAAAFLAMAAGTAVATWQAGRANRARRAADREREVAHVEAYRGKLAGAQGSLEAGNVERSARVLESVPPEQRGWEWQYLTSALDRSIASVLLEGALATALEGAGWLVACVADARGAAILRWVDPFDRPGWQTRELALGIEQPRLAAFSASGKVVALIHGPEAARVAVFQLAIDSPGEGRSPIRTLEAELPGPGVALAVSPEGEFLAVTTLDEAWVFGPDEPTPTRWRHGLGARAIELAEDGGFVAVLGQADPGNYRLYDRRTGEATPSIGRGIVSIALSPDGERLASIEGDAVVRLRDATSGTIELRAAVSTLGPTAIAFDRSGSRLAVADPGGVIGVFDLERWGGFVSDPPLASHDVRRPDARLPVRLGVVERLHFAPGERLVARGGSGEVALFEVASARSTKLGGHASQVTALAGSPDGSLLVSGALDGALRFWDWPSGACFAELASLGQPIVALAVSPDGRRLAVARGLGGPDARVLDVDQPLEARPVPAFGAGLVDLAFAPDGRLATLNRRGEVHAFEPEALALAATLGEPSAGEPPPGWTHGRIAFSLDGRLLASTGVGALEGTGELVLFDVASGRVAVRRAVPAARPLSVAWLPTGACASGWSDGAIRLLEAPLEDPEGEFGEELRSAAGAVLTLDALAGGTRLVAGTERSALEVWDVATRRLTLELPHGGGRIHALACSPDGRQVVSAAMESALTVWDAAALHERYLIGLLGEARRAEVLPRVEALFEQSADPLRVAERVFRDAGIPDAERRAALSWTIDPPLPDPGLEGDPFDGFALRLGGGSARLAIDDDAVLRLGREFTVEAWLRPLPRADGSEPFQILLNKEGEYQIALTGAGELRWLISGAEGWMGPWIPTRYRPPPGSWSHVAFVRDGAALRFFVNGRLVQERTGPMVAGDHHPEMNELWLGNRQHTPTGYHGDLDEVRVWTVARTEAELAGGMHALPGPEAEGLAARWSFDEGAGMVAADASGRHPGRVVGARFVPTEDGR